MNKSVIAGLVIVAFIVLGFVVWENLGQNVELTDDILKIGGGLENGDAPDVEAVVENLTIPWDIAFVGNGEILVTERPGTLLKIGADSTRIEIEGVEHIGEGGLLGIALHPNFQVTKWVYLYLTTESADGLTNRVERYRLVGNELTEKTAILGDIPGARYHDGGRIAFGPDGMLYITTGDATREANAQNKNSLAGKILRINADGSVPTDNPFGNEIYSYGHRNPQGLTWDENGNLWSTEHGRSGALSGLDELNPITRGGNYGWPDSEGDTVLPGTLSPVLHSGPGTTWAPASALYWDGSIFFGGLRGETLYEAVLDGTEIIELREHFAGDFGRIRTVTLGPDGMFYITTSNRDGRGEPTEGDDKIIRVNPSQFR